MTQNGNLAPNKLALAAGFGIGVLWLAMSLWCLRSAMNGYANNRTDYGFLWSVVGVLLLGASMAAFIGTWWHQYPLKRRQHEEH